MSKLVMPQMAHAGQGARIKAAHQERRERELSTQRITVRCAHCHGKRGNGRNFIYTGPIVEARRRFAEHRAQAHPELQALEEVAQQQRRAQRTAKGHVRTQSWSNRREFLTAEQLREREELRRMVRTDLAPLDAEVAA